MNNFLLITENNVLYWVPTGCFKELGEVEKTKIQFFWKPWLFVNICIQLFWEQWLWICVYIYLGENVKKTEFDGCKVFKVKVQRVRKLKEEDKEKSTKGA